jgi:hypothetical protein
VPKRRIRILGWRTPRTPADKPFGMVMPRSLSTPASEVPRSATVVFCLDMEKETTELMQLSRDELRNYKII